MNYRILNSKEVKEIIRIIEQQFSATISWDYVFLANKEDKVHVITRDVAKVLDIKKLRINSLGLYIGQLTRGEFRLSIEGSQMVYPSAGKNVVELDDASAKRFMKGEDVAANTESCGFVIVKNNGEAIGTARVKEGTLLNFNPKTRRILAD